MIEINENGFAVAVYATYNSFKEDLDRELMNEAESFVRVGYMLKLARDTNVLTESGYKTVFEFAKSEYGLDPTMVSRYIGINDTYSVGGYSELLEEKYRGFGYAKLSEMLTLPPAIVEELDPDMTREDIRTIKKAYQEEQQISDIEVAIERAGIIQEQQEIERTGITVETSDFEPADNMQRLIHDFFKDPEHAEEFAWMCSKEEQSIKELYEAIAPSGSRTIIGRVPGQGKLQLTIKGPEQKLAVISYRTGETEYYMWDDLAKYLNKLLIGEESGRERYEKVFETEYPRGEKKEAEKPAEQTAQQSKSKPKPAEKPKAKKVEVVKPKTEKKTEPKEAPEEKTAIKPAETLIEPNKTAKTLIEPNKTAKTLIEPNKTAKTLIEPQTDKTEAEENEKTESEAGSGKTKHEDSENKTERKKMPARAWLQYYRQYYEEWNYKVNKCSELLYDIEQEKIDSDHFMANIKIAEEYMNGALEEFMKIKGLPEVEI